MNLDFISSATAKELQQFKSVCNQLLSRTFVVRTLYRPGRERQNNPDYTFLSIHFEAVRDYLSLLDWDLRHDEANCCLPPVISNIILRAHLPVRLFIVMS